VTPAKTNFMKYLFNRASLLAFLGTMASLEEKAPILSAMEASWSYDDWKPTAVFKEWNKPNRKVRLILQ